MANSSQPGHEAGQQPAQQRQRPRTSDTGSVRVASTRGSAPRKKPVSKAVYRRRRLFVLIVLLLIIGGVTWGIWQASRPNPGGVAPTPSDAAAPVITEHPETGETIPPALQVTPAPISEVPPKCTGGDVYVEALTTVKDYGPGAAAQLGMRLTSQTGTPCSINIGTATQRYTVKSGDDVWFRSTDCQVEPVDNIVTLEPGQVVQTEPFLDWDRLRSSPETCTNPDRERALPGFYSLEVEVGGFASATPADFGIWDE